MVDGCSSISTSTKTKSQSDKLYEFADSDAACNILKLPRKLRLTATISGTSCYWPREYQCYQLADKYGGKGDATSSKSDTNSCCFQTSSIDIHYCSGNSLTTEELAIFYDWNPARQPVKTNFFILHRGETNQDSFLWRPLCSSDIGLS